MLQEADSLFAEGNTAAADSLYKNVLRRGQVSPQLLLRLAAVQESRHQYPAALYYLSLYQAHYPSRGVWRKTVELAQTHRLTGYPDTWQQQVRIALQHYYPTILQLLLAVAVSVGVLMVFRRRGVSRGWWVAYGVYVLGVGAVVWLLDAQPAGLVCRPRAALMAAPSAAGEWLTTAAAGDRLLVRGRQDIWFKVQWRGRPAYIRQHDLLLVE